MRVFPVLSWLGVWLAAASPAAAGDAVAPAAPERILVLDLKPSGVEPRVAQVATRLVSLELSEDARYDVVTSAELQQVAALEGERQKLDCDGDNSCLAEIAGAMGTRLVVFGDISRLGSIMLVNLSLFDSEEVRPRARIGFRVESEEALADAIPPAVKELTQAPAAASEDNGAGGAVWPVVGWSLVGVGAAGTAVGLLGLVVGLVPGVGHAVARGQIDALEAEQTLDNLDDAKALQATQSMWAGWWSPWGMIAAGAGAGAAVLALAATGAGVAMVALAPGGETE